ncbi:MAG: hypothetical protein ACYC08_04395 [Armatimonadota bacterium]
MEAAIKDITFVEKLLEDFLAAAPASVCWDAIDRCPPMHDALGRYEGRGFTSLGHAVHTFIARLCGMKAALTTDTDALLTIEERKSRDTVVRAFLENVQEFYLNTERH